MVPAPPKAVLPSWVMVAASLAAPTSLLHSLSWFMVLAPPKVVLPSRVVFAAPLAAPTAWFHEDFCIAASAVSLIVLVDVPLAALTARFLEFFCIAISAVLLPLHVLMIFRPFRTRRSLDGSAS